MNESPECVKTDDGGDRDDSGSRGESSAKGTVGSTRFTRRQALAAVGTVSIGSMAGCLNSLPFLDNSRVPVEPEEPDDDDPDASPEAFYYILEDNGITVDELYYDTEEDDLILFYESDAEDREASDEEVWLIYVLFRDGLVDRGTEANHLYTEVLDRFDGQVEGWGANSQWAEEELAGSASEIDVWNKLIDTMVYPDDESRYDHDVGNDTDADVVLGEESSSESADDPSNDTAGESPDESTTNESTTNESTTDDE